MAKPKLDLETLKQLALEYGEKVGFGLAILIFLLLTYKAVTGMKADPAKTSEKLVEAVNQAQTHIDSSNFDPKEHRVEVTDYLARSKMDEVRPDHFKLGPFNTPVVEPKGKRPDPPLFAVEQLRVAAGAGSFGVKVAEVGKAAENEDTVLPWPPAVPYHAAKIGGSDKAEPRYWAILTGLVPLQKQSEAFDVFKRSLGDYSAKRDTPEYARCSVARSEVTANGQGEWETLKPEEAKSEQERWGDIKPLRSEVVESRYVRPRITVDVAPLLFTIASGPYVNPQWMDEAAHPPEIPLKSAVVPGAAPPAARADADAADTPEEKRPPAPVSKAGEPQYLLFRFMDCSAQPGKQYRYRVRLHLKNPNYNVERRLLRDPKSAELVSRETGWSEPTPVVAIPTGVELLAGPPKSGARGEVRPTIMVAKLDKARGVIAAAIEEVALGTVLNFKKTVWAVDPVGPRLRQLRDHVFETEAMVLDIHGGKSASDAEKSSGDPVEILIADKAGRLSVRSETADAQSFGANMVSEPKVPEKTDIFAPGFGAPLPKARVIPGAAAAGARGPRKPAAGTRK